MRSLPIHAAVARAREHQGPDKPSRGILWTLFLSALIWLPLAWAVISIVRSL